MIAVVQRGKPSPSGTFGSLFINGKFFCYTLEPKEPITPQGIYKIVRHGWEENSPVKFKKTWEITSVPGHTAVLIHAGNTTSDTRGCILVGMGLAVSAITRSREAVDALRKIFPATPFMLEIRDA